MTSREYVATAISRYSGHAFAYVVIAATARQASKLAQQSLPRVLRVSSVRAVQA